MHRETTRRVTGSGSPQSTVEDRVEPVPGDAVRATLLDMLVKHSYHRAPDDRFELSSGKRSNFYIDCKTTTMRGAAMPYVASEVVARFPADADAVGGLTLGADAIAGAVAFYCQTIGRFNHHPDSWEQSYQIENQG